MKTVALALVVLLQAAAWGAVGKFRQETSSQGNVAATMVKGRVELDTGGRLPIWTPSRTMPDFAPDGQSLVGIRVRRVDCSQEVEAKVQSDGLFTLSGTPGDYEVRVGILPVGYYVRTISYGQIDLRRERLRIDSGPPQQQVQIVLTTVRPSGAPPEVKVSGRLTNLPQGKSASSHVLTFSMIASDPMATATTVTHIGEATMREDGTFELLHVPSGSWNIDLMDLDTRQRGSAKRIAVSDKDVTDVEVSVRPPNRLSLGMPVMPPRLTPC